MWARRMRAVWRDISSLICNRSAVAHSAVCRKRSSFMTPSLAGRRTSLPLALQSGQTRPPRSDENT